MGKKMIRRLGRGLVLCILLALLPACASGEVSWNEQTQYTHVLLAIDETDLRQYVGTVDYVFVGRVLEADVAVTLEDDKSQYTIQVEQNLKGALVPEVTCSKHGGILPDGTRVLYASDRVQDTGLPEVGKRYLFMAYAQSDGSLLLSELYGSVEATAENIALWQGYVADQIPYDRQRFVSKYDATA